jgi:membrane protein
MRALKFKKFAKFVGHNFVKDDCFYRTSALAFSTILTIIPMVYIILFFLSFSSITQQFALPIQNFIFNNFLPTTGYLIRAHIQEVAHQSRILPSGDILFVVLTAFFMMFTVEQSLNVIWHAPKARHNFKAFLLYFAIIGFAPLLLGFSLAASSYLFSLPFIHDVPILPSLSLRLLPFYFSLLGFTFLYVIVPSCPVRFSEGFIGGIFAACAFELVKKGFGFYLLHMGSYHRLYGAFAVIPVFLIWVYLVWFITLLGAEIGYAYGKLVLKRS